MGLNPGWQYSIVIGVTLIDVDLGHFLSMWPWLYHIVNQFAADEVCVQFGHFSDLFCCVVKDRVNIPIGAEKNRQSHKFSRIPSYENDSDLQAWG